MIKSSSQHGDLCQVITLKGRFIEDHESDHLNQHIAEYLEKGIKYIIVDLGEVAYLNSSGINSITKAVKKVNNQNGRIIFAAVPERIHELLHVIKLNAILEIVPSVEKGKQLLNLP